MAKINFIGKGDVYSHHLTIPHHELVVDEKKSVLNNFADENLIINGDNLLALKSLIPKYEGKVKCIYIDPPYNTDNDKWVYNDNVNSPALKEWLGKLVDSEDQNRHDKWLCMMWPRLHLLRDLLTDDGAIFISCDDNELHNLRSIMDEIFGEDNFFGIFAIKTPNQTENKNRLRNIDFLIVYSKEIENFSFTVDSKPQSARCTTGKEDQTQPEIEFPKGIEVADAKDGTYDAPKKIGGNEDIQLIKGKIIVKNGKLAEPITLKARWSNPNDIKQMIEKHKNASNEPIYNKYGKELTKLWLKGEKFQPQMDKIGGDLPDSIWDSFTSKGSSALRKILPSASFNYPKHPDFIKHIIRLSTEKDSIVLDSFAGSGTTGEAVLRLNKEENDSNRKFILVQCNEWDNEKEKEIDICNKITAERIRCLINGIPKSKDGNLKKGLGGGFTYSDIGKAIDFDKIILGKNLPTYQQLAELLFFQVTGETLGKFTLDKKTWFIGETKKYRVHLIYDNDIKFLQEANLKSETLDKMSENLKKGQKLFIFASGRYVDSEHLKNKNALFSYIPHEIHRDLS